ncbi:hypothetical protein AVEN_249437-1 [Araneus ventricosus]|uniref:Uncharacterized protein n=1 Tax=Araneus ventricosus TaxID=182803 RepID=A0A4Y2RHE6_ARAVE|nr:hypothetical protein AVEN_249437-1 [Araneus ventricosus]
MKGIAVDIYQALLPNEIATTSDFIICCNYIDDMKKKRNGRMKFERLPNVVSMAEMEDEPDLLPLILRIVQEEVQRMITRIDKPADS